MSATIANYGDGNALYVSALLEPDRIRLPERIMAAEAAINQRLNALANRDDSEKTALCAACPDNGSGRVEVGICSTELEEASCGFINDRKIA